MNKPPNFPKGDLRRMLAVLAAIDALGPEATLVQVSARSGLDKKTVTSLILAATVQAGVSISKTGSSYSIDDWGNILQKKGVRLILSGTPNAPAG